MRRRWSEEEDALLRDLFKVGKTDRQIAADLGAVGKGRTVTAVSSRRETLKLTRTYAPTARVAKTVRDLTPDLCRKMDAEFVRAMMRVGYVPQQPRRIA